MSNFNHIFLVDAYCFLYYLTVCFVSNTLYRCTYFISKYKYLLLQHIVFICVIYIYIIFFNLCIGN